MWRVTGCQVPGANACSLAGVEGLYRTLTKALLDVRTGTAHDGHMTATTIRITNDEVDPRLRRLRHDFDGPGYGGYHQPPRWCSATGVHLTSQCAVDHRAFPGGCPVVRLYCPERGVEIQVRVTV